MCRGQIKLVVIEHTTSWRVLVKLSAPTLSILRTQKLACVRKFAYLCGSDYGVVLALEPDAIPRFITSILSSSHSMQIEFTKMNGAGNDFVVLDNRDGRYAALDQAAVARLCDRHRGIGADGLLAVEPAAPGSDADFTFRYYNADGGEAEMCGNGARCFGKFARQFVPAERDAVTFDTIAGRIRAEFCGDNVRIQLSEPHDFRIGLDLVVGENTATIHHVNTGVPHAVLVLDDNTELESVDVRGLGSALRYHNAFAPKGTNANFQKVLAPGSISIRTYERGVEDETLACGTGMVANAIVHHLLTGAASPIRVLVRGGDWLEVGFTAEGPETFRDVTLTGPADITFTGTFPL